MSKRELETKASDSAQQETLRMTRRHFIGFSGALMGSALLGGCGGGDDAPASTTGAATPSAPATPADPIWGANGAATNIIASLNGITQSAFRAVDYPVEAYGAQPCPVVAQTSPYTDLTKSPVSPGAGATPGAGAFDSRPAFLAAIAACSAAGGGRVVVPAGSWYCAGPIVLQSNVNFHLSANCTIFFSPNPADYAKDGPVNCGANGNLYYSRWQANDCLNFGAPVYARNANNIALTGEGPTSTLNGQAMTPFAGSGNTATCWWTYKGSSGAYGCAGSSTPSQAYTNPNNVDLKTVAPGISSALYTLLTNPTTPWQQDQNYLPALSEAGVPVAQRIFGLGHFLRPCMVEFIGCTNVLMENYHTQNTPFWQHHPTDCTNVVIRGVMADSIGPNNDGFDPDACNNVLCDGMVFNTGDDCIAIKSGKDLDTEYGAAQNHVVQNCTMNSGHGGITLGSEMGGGIENVYARNLTMLNQFWATNSLNIAIRIKTNMNRGGFVRNFYVNGVTLPNGVSLTGGGYGSKLLTGSPINATVPLGVASATAGNPSASQGGLITFDCDYQPAGDAIRTRPALVQNVNITNVTASNVTLGSATGSCFQAIVAQGPVAFDYNGAAPTPAIPAITGVTISNCDFGTPVAAGPASTTTPGPIYAWNVNGITLQNVKIAGQLYNTTITDAR
ncbi:Glycoside hydrolase [Burkholderia glumae BGR1]|nr:Glycoside hydrolase [Burkholderia glumae BGR1]AJY64683.1 glycosyl hydrolases 28 family protein [Burkholderia glumae LMG 2196 = ATCC 33617]KHJ64453.1 endopolygalacturonase [Burkholderia glumae]QKM57069.1 Polygalacturonase [Burkholderia glumae]QTP35794.1 Polygalacturonase [Burkholderia glumae]